MQPQVDVCAGTTGVFSNATQAGHICDDANGDLVSAASSFWGGTEQMCHDMNGNVTFVSCAEVLQFFFQGTPLNTAECSGLECDFLATCCPCADDACAAARESIYDFCPRGSMVGPASAYRSGSADKTGIVEVTYDSSKVFLLAANLDRTTEGEWRVGVEVSLPGEDYSYLVQALESYTTTVTLGKDMAVSPGDLVEVDGERMYVSAVQETSPTQAQTSSCFSQTPGASPPGVFCLHPFDCCSCHCNSAMQTCDAAPTGFTGTCGDSSSGDDMQLVLTVVRGVDGTTPMYHGDGAEVNLVGVGPLDTVLDLELKAGRTTATNGNTSAVADFDAPIGVVHLNDLYFMVDVDKKPVYCIGFESEFSLLKRRPELMLQVDTGHLHISEYTDSGEIKEEWFDDLAFGMHMNMSSKETQVKFHASKNHSSFDAQASR